MKTQNPKQLRGAGIAFLGAGVAFAAATLAAGQPAFIGVGASLVALGVVFLARSRRDADR